MLVEAISSPSVSIPLNGIWRIEVGVYDVDGYLTDAEPTITITSPEGAASTPAITHVSTGYYRVLHTVDTLGRYTADAISSGYGAAQLTSWVFGVVSGTGLFPTVSEVSAYLGGSEGHSYEDSELQGAYDAEAQAQRDRCDIPATYTAALREALFRRVARNLTMRRIPLAIPQGDAESGPTIIPGSDPEVRRFEAPYRKLVIG